MATCINRPVPDAPRLNHLLELLHLFLGSIRLDGHVSDDSIETGAVNDAGRKKPA
jgi:hypothetical protein